MKASEFKSFDKVLVTTTQKKGISFATAEQKKKKEAFDVERVEVITQIATIVRKQYCYSLDSSNGKNTIIYDGWVYFCDNGQAYYPGLDNGGHVVELTAPTPEEIELYA